MGIAVREGCSGFWVGLTLLVGTAACTPSSVAVESLPGGTERPPPVEVPSTPGIPVVEMPNTPGPSGVETFPKQCAELFSDDEVQEFHIEIDPADWAGLENEHFNSDALKAQGIPIEVYRPLAKFEHQGKTVTDAMIRLRGNPSGWGDDQNKLQFQISFKEKDPDGRFRGLRKIVLDSAYYNASMLRDRLAASIFHSVGVSAPCINHAKLFVNGAFYGLYTHIEKVDREFLERNFRDPDGNLWKRGTQLKTNEDENPDDSRMKRFWGEGALHISEFESMADIDAAVRAWAVEAVLPDEDGYWAGGANFYFYEDPAGRFTYLPWDLDRGFEKLPSTVDPLLWDKTQRPDAGTRGYHGHPHWDLVRGDSWWRARFVEEVAFVLDRSPTELLQARIDHWAGQIEDAAREDLLPPWTFEQHQFAVTKLRNYVERRAEWLRGWVECARQNDYQTAGCP